VDEHRRRKHELCLGRRLQWQLGDLCRRLLDRRDVLRAERDHERRLRDVSARHEHHVVDQRKRRCELSVGRSLQRRKLRRGLLDQRDFLHAERNGEQRLRGVRPGIEHHVVDRRERPSKLSRRRNLQRRELLVPKRHEHVQRQRSVRHDIGELYAERDGRMQYVRFADMQLELCVELVLLPVGASLHPQSGSMFDDWGSPGL
jgi:hypothetical protein